MTLALTDLGPFRTLHFFSYFDDLEQWLGEVNTAVNASYQRPHFSSPWQVTTMENPTQSLAKLRPAKAEVTATISEQELALFLSWATLHLLISTALGSPPLCCMLKGPTVNVALCSFARLLHFHGTGMRTWQTTMWSYCNLLSITLNALDMARDPGQYSSHLTPSPKAQYSFPKRCLLGPPTERAVCRSSRVNKTQGKDIKS